MIDRLDQVQAMRHAAVGSMGRGPRAENERYWNTLYLYSSSQMEERLPSNPILMPSNHNCGCVGVSAKQSLSKGDRVISLEITTNRVSE